MLTAKRKNSGPRAERKWAKMAGRRPQKTRARRSREECRRDLLAVAGELFFSRGYAATRLDEIVAQAGGSRREIYRLVGNKRGLFRAVIEEHLARSEVAQVGPVGLPTDTPEALTHIARRHLALLLSPEALALHRSVVAESLRFPELARTFLERVPERATRQVGELLEYLAVRDEWRLDAPSLAAAKFIALLEDGLHLRALLGLPAPSPAEREASIRRSVALFLHGTWRRE